MQASTTAFNSSLRNFLSLASHHDGQRAEPDPSLLGLRRQRLAHPARRASPPDNKLDAAAAAMKRVSMVRVLDSGRLKRLMTAKNRASPTKAGRPLPRRSPMSGLSVEEYDEIPNGAIQIQPYTKKFFKRIK